MKAHVLGLQGEKRQERSEARKEHMLVQHFRHIAYDLFDVGLEPDVNLVTFPSVPNISGYFEVYIKKLWATYDELSKISNDLVIAKYKPLSKCIDEHVCRIQNEIIAAKRLLKEYKLANESYHHISRYEVGYHNVHDENEKVENKEGYNY